MHYFFNSTTLNNYSVPLEDLDCCERNFGLLKMFQEKLYKFYLNSKNSSKKSGNSISFVNQSFVTAVLSKLYL